MFLFYFANLRILEDEVDKTIPVWCSQGAVMAVHKPVLSDKSPSLFKVFVQIFF